MKIHSGSEWRQVPDAWVFHNWELPFAFLNDVQNELSSSGTQYSSHGYCQDKVLSGFDSKRALARRSLTSTRAEHVPAQKFREILRSIYQALNAEPHLFAGLATANVEGWPDSFWMIDHSPRSLLRCSTDFSEDLVSQSIQGQFWVRGPGVTILIGIDWDYVGRGRGRESAYADALFTCGRVGQAIVLDATHIGLVARMTPAIHESTAAECLELGDDRDVLYALRLAIAKGETR